MIGNKQRNLKHSKRIHGETFHVKFPLRVYSKNYFHSGESQFKSSFIFAAAVSNAAISLFFSWKSCFSSGCLLNYPQKNIDSHFAIRQVRTLWFLS